MRFEKNIFYILDAKVKNNGANLNTVTKQHDGKKDFSLDRLAYHKISSSPLCFHGIALFLFSDT